MTSHTDECRYHWRSQRPARMRLRGRVGAGMSIDQVTVARMAAALADIADRHQPDLMSSTETLRCDWCSQQAGIPVPWPCMDRGAIGDLLPLPNNRLLPP